MKYIQAEHTHYGASHGTFRSYALGYCASVVLTLVAFALVFIHVNSAHETFSHSFLISAIVDLAIVQLIVQAIFFLHLSSHSKARWNLTVFVFALLIVTIVVGGSLWIMDNLNYNMSQAQMSAYMNNQN